MGKILDGGGCVGWTQTLLMPLTDEVLKLGLWTPECPVPSLWAHCSLESLFFGARETSYSQIINLFPSSVPVFSSVSLITPP